MSPDHHYVGVDVGTGSARACVIDSGGEIKALAERKIRLWQPRTGYYVRRLNSQAWLAEVVQLGLAPGHPGKSHVDTKSTRACMHAVGTINSRHLALNMPMRPRRGGGFKCVCPQHQGHGVRRNVLPRRLRQGHG